MHADLVRYTPGQIESAVARLGRRPRGEGVSLPIFAHTGRRVAGIAIPVVVSTDEGGPARENLDWWKHLESIQGQKIVVAQDVSRQKGTGAVCGRLTAHVLHALGCLGFVSDGYVRDVDDFGQLSVFAAGLTLRHGNPHIVRWGEPVTVAGMRVSPGDAIVVGGEGAVAFPAAWLPDMPRALGEVSKRIDPLIAYCNSGGATADGIAKMLNVGGASK